MLLESLVKATVELQGFRVVMVTGDVGGLVAELAPDLRFAPRCGQCGDRGGYRDTRRVRRFRHVPLWGIPVAMRYAPRRVHCSRCAGVHVESMPWVSGKQQLTRALMVTLATWARALPWQQVARLFRCSWGTVATAVDEAVVLDEQPMGIQTWRDRLMALPGLRLLRHVPSVSEPTAPPSILARQPALTGSEQQLDDPTVPEVLERLQKLVERDGEEERRRA